MHPPNRRRPQHPANRRRPRPLPARDPFVRLQLRRAGMWLRALSRSIQDRLVSKPAADDSAVFGQSDELGQIPQPWDGQPRQPDPAVSRQPTDDPRPAFSRQAADLGRRASNLGRQLAPHAIQFGRQLGPLARRGAFATGRGMRAAIRGLAGLRPLLRLLHRFFAAVGDLTFRFVAALGALLAATRRGLGALVTRHRAVLFALFTRVLWWGSLALLLLGGQALVEIHGRAPLDQQALPAFAAGLGLCALLVLIAAQARLRWAALVLGFGHGGLLALVWVVAAAIQH